MRRRNESDAPANVSLPAGIATTAAVTPTTPAGTVTVPANAARNASAAFAFFDPRPNAYGDAPADPATTSAPPGALAIDTPRSPSNGSPPPQTAAAFALPLASRFQTNASAPDG